MEVVVLLVGFGSSLVVLDTSLRLLESGARRLTSCDQTLVNEAPKHLVGMAGNVRYIRQTSGTPSRNKNHEQVSGRKRRTAHARRRWMVGCISGSCSKVVGRIQVDGPLSNIKERYWRFLGYR